MTMYADSFTTWSYAKMAFDQWAELLKKRFNELRGIETVK
jgi:hypothetical protein